MPAILPGKQNTVGAGHARELAWPAEYNGYACRVMQRCQIAIAGMASSYRPYRWALLQTIPPGTLLQAILLGTQRQSSGHAKCCGIAVTGSTF